MLLIAEDPEPDFYDAAHQHADDEKTALMPMVFNEEDDERHSDHERGQ